MLKRIFPLLFLIGFIEIYSLLPHREVAPVIPPVPYQSAIIHVHSVFSDGGGTVPEIAEAARQAGMNMVILTDHRSSEARRQGFEKNYDGVDMFVEMEAETTAGHAIFFYSHTDVRNLPDPDVNGLAWNHFLGWDVRPGVFLVISHPSNIKNPWKNLARYPEGWEAINLDSIWQREANDALGSFLVTAGLIPFNTYLAVIRFFQIYPKDFTALDNMNAISPGHFAILAHDTHQRIKVDPKRSLPWPDYLSTFKLASNIVYYDAPLAADFEARKRQLYESIRSGRMAMTFQAIHPFAGNDWSIKCGSQGESLRSKGAPRGRAV